ncbi:MAG TPA: hypothetical protein ENN80_01485 [Candidatus Hydrogenedentes bacterium]|mgnify:CR=1 FL=1|nr:hypothetical protein [Candidatus Hydrogenedentota bacterium]
MDMARAWPIVLQFGVGSVLCAVGLWGGIRSGYLDLANRADRRTIYIIIGGFLALLAFSCAFTFWLPYLPKELSP